jgi:hypothetical protein
MIVSATRTVVTSGTYMGEEGTGYSWGPSEHYGDISRATRGHIEGWTEPCRIEVLAPGAELLEAANRPEEVYLFLPGEKYGLSVQDAIDLGLARVVED